MYCRWIQLSNFDRPVNCDCVAIRTVHLRQRGENGLWTREHSCGLVFLHIDD